MEPADERIASTQHLEFAAALESIAGARDAVGDVLTSAPGAPIPESTVADVQLVVSELVTNSVIHSSRPTTLVIEISDDIIRCSVTSSFAESADGPVLPPTRWTAPPASARSGRGLAIVHAVADSVSTVIVGATWTIRCEFART